MRKSNFLQIFRNLRIHYQKILETDGKFVFSGFSFLLRLNYQ